MSEQECKTLGEMISEALPPHGQKWLAWRCGVSQSAVAHWISGATRPTLPIMLLLASALPSLDRRQLAAAAGHDPDRLDELWSLHFG
jgi:hypothetical protein